jgi:glutathione S-transferase
MRRNYVSVEEAVSLPGLRIAFTRGVPGPWGEAARALFDIKGIDYTPVVQHGGAPNEALRAWTGQNSAPVAVLNDERPRSLWSEILMLAERLGPEPRLIPADEDERAVMFGLAHEMCGEDGFGWSGRLLTFEVIEKMNAEIPIANMRRKFASDSSSPQRAAARMISVMAMLARRLMQQVASGSSYLVGNDLSAADIYWTTFSNMLAPIAESACPMPGYYRTWCERCADMIGSPVPEILIAHRERILRDHFILPMWF